MRRSVYLEKKSATLEGNTYKFKINRDMDPKFTAFQLQNAMVEWNPTESSSTTAADIDLLNPYFFLDFNPVRIAPANIDQNALDSTHIDSIVCTGTATVTLYSSSSSGLVYTNINNAPAFLSSINWHNFVDSSKPQSVGGQSDQSQFVFMFQNKPTSSTFWLWRNRIYRVMVAGAVLRIVADAVNHDTSIALAVDTPYIVSLTWNDPEMSCKVINLLDNVVQTEVLNIPLNLAPSPDYNVYCGYASTSLQTAKMGVAVEVFSTSSSVNDTIVAYMKQLYSGVGGSVTSTAHSLRLESKFLTDSRQSNSIEDGSSDIVAVCNYFGALGSNSLFKMDYTAPLIPVDDKHLDVVDISFTNPAGEKVQVEGFSVALDLMDDRKGL